MAAAIDDNTFTRLRALYSYTYLDDDGRTIGMVEGEEYILLRKTSADWWHVLKLNDRLPFYVPANYVEVIYAPKTTSGESEDDDGEASDDSLLSPSTKEARVVARSSPTNASPKLPDKPRQTAPSPTTPVTPATPPTPHDGTLGLASVLAQEAQKLKRQSFLPRETPSIDGTDSGPSAKPARPSAPLAPPTTKTVDYVNLADYQKAAGIGIYAKQPTSPPLTAESPTSLLSAPQLAPQSECEYMNLATIQHHINQAAPAPRPPAGAVPVKLLADQWAQYTDEQTLRTYYYNSATNDTSWKPPRTSVSSAPCKRENSSDDSLDSSRDESEDTFRMTDTELPSGYFIEISDSGLTSYVNGQTNEKWLSSVDAAGKRYFYQDGNAESVWALPEIESSPRRGSIDSNMRELDEVRRVVSQRSSERHLRAKSMMASLTDSHFAPPGAAGGAAAAAALGARHATMGVNKRTPVAPTSTLVGDNNAASMRFDLEDLVTVPRPDGAYSLIVKPPERRGIVNKTKIMEAGKRVNKKWAQTYLVLTGPSLLFYKDQKASLAKCSKPDTVIDLCGAEIEWGSKDVTSRKNVIQLSANGAVFLLQLDDGLKAHEWNVALRQSHDFSKQLVSELPAWEQNSKPPPNQPPPAVNKFKRSKSAKTLQKNVFIPEEITPNRNNIRDRLLNFILRRPSIDVLQEKGIIKNSVVFGAHIRDICDRESSTIPKFVMQCVAAIEAKGLMSDGIYRLSGNLAQVQKLRFVVEQNEKYDLMGPDWDLHVLTGALKLFFRELKEPVFPFQFYEQFCRASTIRDEVKKSDAIRDLIAVMPKQNHDTLKLLFRHLNNVINNASINRMQIQSIAIVFGPTLMWPESENANMAVNTVIQNQIIELILTYSAKIFSS